MKIFKKLLFLICISPVSVMLGMEERKVHKLLENEQDLTEFQKKQYTQIMNTVKESETVSFDRYSPAELSQCLGEGSEVYSNSYYSKDEEYLEQMNNTKLLNFIRFNSIQDPSIITRLHCFIAYIGFERPMRKKIHNEYFTALTNTDLKNKQLQGQIKELTEKNEKLAQKNKQKKLEITELANQNKNQAAEIGKFQTAEKARQALRLNEQQNQQNQNQPSWWQRIAPKVSVAAVMGGCMLLGASLYACFAAK